MQYEHVQPNNAHRVVGDSGLHGITNPFNVCEPVLRGANAFQNKQGYRGPYLLGI